MTYPHPIELDDDAWQSNTTNEQDNLLKSCDDSVLQWVQTSKTAIHDSELQKRITLELQKLKGADIPKELISAFQEIVTKKMPVCTDSKNISY